jgi:hypothetical protein
MLANLSWDWEMWAMLAVSCVVVPTVGWLIREVLSLRKDILKIQHAIAAQQELCSERKIELTRGQATMTRLDRNLVRLCQHAGVDYEHP